MVSFTIINVIERPNRNRTNVKGLTAALRLVISWIVLTVLWLIAAIVGYLNTE